MTSEDIGRKNRTVANEQIHIWAGGTREAITICRFVDLLINWNVLRGSKRLALKGWRILLTMDAFWADLRKRGLTKYRSVLSLIKFI